MTCEVITMESGISKSCVHRVLAEVLQKLEVALRSTRRNTKYCANFKNFSHLLQVGSSV